ncbi:hypothetical protein M0805_007643 [Coniferiporia weirii]|nr:hypothetical protein M0805_007643 [Coniferiporia weirii]
MSWKGEPVADGWSPSAKSDSNASGSDLSAQAKARKIRERELERKRARGEVSCAECRRLKLKCNKKVPCASCIRRGCHSICPNGSLASGQGTRFVLANTDKLHSKLLEMSKRIRQLEDALQIAQALMSSEPHPLLFEDLLSIKAGVDIPSGDEHVKLEENHEEDPEMSAEFGNLTIAEQGEARPAGCPGSEFIAAQTAYKEFDIINALPDEINHAAKAFPFAPVYLPKDQIYALIEAQLPSYERATALVEAYLEHVTWFFRPVKREQIMEDLLPIIYKRRWSEQPNSEKECFPKAEDEAHRLALLLMVLACGAVADLTLAPSNAEAELYNHLGRAALSLRSVFDGASFRTVQAVMLLAIYDFFSCAKASNEYAWKMLSFGLVLASSIGLHHDPARYNMNPKHMDNRRGLFWEIFSVDKWKSLGSGRPAIFHLSEVDCQIPKEVTVSEDGKELSGLYSWKYRFTKEITGPVSEHLCLARPTKYSEILEFDRKIRDFEDHPFVKKPTSEYLKFIGTQQYTWSMFKEIVLIMIHRNFFARAMLEYPDNPMRSPFALSFLAAYSTSITLLRGIRTVIDHNPHVLLRQWAAWAHTLTAAIIVGSVASRSKAPMLAPAAFKELDCTITLLEKAEGHPVVRSGLPILRRLHEKAIRSLQSASVSETGVPKQLPIQRNVEDAGGKHERSIPRDTVRSVQAPKRSRSKKADTRSTGTKSNTSLSQDSAEGDKSNSDSSNAPSPPTNVPTVTANTLSTMAAPIQQQPNTHIVNTPLNSSSSSSASTGMDTSGISTQGLFDVGGIPARSYPKQQDAGPTGSDVYSDLSTFMDFINSNDLSSICGAPTPSTAQISVNPQLYDPIMRNDIPYGQNAQEQTMIMDDWSELGLRTVMESLTSEPARSYPTGVDTISQGTMNNAFGVTGGPLLGAGVQSNLGNASIGTVPSAQSAGLPTLGKFAPGGYDVRWRQGGDSLTDATLSGTSDDASLVEAWRSISEYSQFTGLEMDQDLYL